ncbi:Copper resistance protein B precursor [Pseudomonas aeruginosa]|nr:Copper resistance protein B precursor [Pseudomonas aeruginosa]
MRQDFKPGSPQTWAAFGVQGLALYDFEAEVTAFLGENGQSALRLEGEYDILLTNRLILQPSAEVNLYGRNDPARGIGSGLADSELGLRLRYEIRREFAPYIGVTWNRSYGNSAELARALGATAHAYQVDVGDTQAMERFAEWVRDTLGVPDVVVSNAGIGMAGPMLDTSPAEWERLLRVNLWSVIDGCRLFGRQMIAANKPGHLVNVASGVAFAPSRNYPAYATSKAAVLMLSECLRAELAGRSIGVTAVCPGFVDTGIVQATRFVGMDAERQARRQAKIQRFYKRRRLSPDTVGEKLVRAVERNKAVVSVGSEVHLGALQWRFAPWATRFLARFDLTS